MILKEKKLGEISKINDILKNILQLSTILPEPRYYFDSWVDYITKNLNNPKNVSSIESFRAKKKKSLKNNLEFPIFTLEWERLLIVVQKNLYPERNSQDKMKDKMVVNEKRKEIHNITINHNNNSIENNKRQKSDSQITKNNKNNNNNNIINNNNNIINVVHPSSSSNKSVFPVPHQPSNNHSVTPTNLISQNVNFHNPNNNNFPPPNNYHPHNNHNINNPNFTPQIQNFQQNFNNPQYPPPPQQQQKQPHNQPHSHPLLPQHQQIQHPNHQHIHPPLPQQQQINQSPNKSDNLLINTKKSVQIVCVSCKKHLVVNLVDQSNVITITCPLCNARMQVTVMK